MHKNNDERVLSKSEKCIYVKLLHHQSIHCEHNQYQKQQFLYVSIFHGLVVCVKVVLVLYLHYIHSIYEK